MFLTLKIILKKTFKIKTFHHQLVDILLRFFSKLKQINYHNNCKKY